MGPVLQQTKQHNFQNPTVSDSKDGLLNLLCIATNQENLKLSNLPKIKLKSTSFRLERRVLHFAFPNWGYRAAVWLALSHGVFQEENVAGPGEETNYCWMIEMTIG
jgi:hypothetical protein